MDTLTSSDLITFMLAQRESMDAQIQFWISVTFALVVVSFSAGEKLSFQLRMLAGMLYLLATYTFVARWIHDYSEMALMLQEINSRGLVEFTALTFPAAARFLLVIMGTLTAMVFLFKKNILTKIY